MDSASTLTHANPTGSISGVPNNYVLMPNSMKNTTIFANAEPLYTITTNVSDTHTHVDKVQTGHHIATITRRDILPDTVTFSDRRYNSGKQMSVHKWLKRGKFPDGYPVHFMQTVDGTKVYFWKSDATQRLGLYQAGVDGNRTQPQRIAFLRLASPTHPLTLFLDPIAEPIRDEIVVACLILEQRLRVTERDISVGGGKFEQNKTVLGHHVHT